MSDVYTPASEVADIAKKLIKKHHDHLTSRRVECLFVERMDKDGNSQAITSKGKHLYGQAKLMTGLNAYLACAPRAIEDPTPFFVILISKHWWPNASDLFKTALVDHELSHCEYDSENDRYSLVDHDVTEFTAIVKRYGLWNSDVETFVKAAKQEKLKFEEPAAETPEASTTPPKAKVVKGSGKDSDPTAQQIDKACREGFFVLIGNRQQVLGADSGGTVDRSPANKDQVWVHVPHAKGTGLAGEFVSIGDWYLVQRSKVIITTEQFGNHDDVAHKPAAPRLDSIKEHVAQKRRRAPLGVLP
jgi:hypothetical protein